MTTDWQDDQPHPHMALAQYTQGIPLARKPNNLGTTAGSLPPATTQPLFTAVAQDQPGWQMLLFLTTAIGAPTVPFCKLSFTWQDSATMLSAVTESYVLPFGTTSPCVYILDGPARLDLASASLGNLDPAVGCDIQFSYTETSHMWLVPRCLETTFVPVPQFTRPVGNPLDGVLGSMMTTIAASGHSDRLAASWAGGAMVVADNTGGTADIIVQLLDPGAVLGGSTLYGTASTGVLWGDRVAAGTSASLEAELPNGPVVMRVTNTSASVSVSPTVTLLRVDQ